MVRRIARRLDRGIHEASKGDYLVDRGKYCTWALPQGARREAAGFPEGDPSPCCTPCTAPCRLDEIDQQDGQSARDEARHLC